MSTGAWRIGLTVECDANSISEAEDIARMVWERCQPMIRDIEGVRWMLPVAECSERRPFSVPREGRGNK